MRGCAPAPLCVPQVYNQVMVCLYISQLTLLGLLSLKRFPWAVLLVPLLLATMTCHIATLRLFSRPWCGGGRPGGWGIGWGASGAGPTPLKRQAPILITGCVRRCAACLHGTSGHYRQPGGQPAAGGSNHTNTLVSAHNTPTPTPTLMPPPPRLLQAPDRPA